MTTGQLAFLERLQLDEEAEERDIRRTYARELKRIDQETDPAGFQSLREAYEVALQWAAWKRQQQEAVPSESSASPGVQAPVAAREDTMPAASAAAIADPNVFGAVPEADAGEVFAEFVARSGALAPAADAYRLWQRELERCLDDPRLIHVAARDIFEWHVAVLLAQGWRPGHEALLVAAVRVFDWSDDRKRLLRFGRPGEIVNRAIEERVVFDLQPDQVRAWQRDIIARLRKPGEPSHGELIARMALAEAVVAQFPVWVPLITSMENLQRWRQLNDKVPGWRRKLSFRRRLPRIKIVKPAGNPASGKIQVWWIVVCFLAVFRAMTGDPASTVGQYSSSASQGSYSQPGTGSSALDILGRAKGNYLPAAPAGTNPYRPADSSLYGRESPGTAPPVPPSKAQLSAVVRGKPTFDKCSEVGRLAALYRIGTAQASAKFGSEFDQQVIACVNAHLWPRPAYQDPAILSAVNNEQTRSRAEIAALTRDMTARQKPVPQPANATAFKVIPEALWKPPAAENQAPYASGEQPWISKSTAEKYRLDAKE